MTTYAVTAASGKLGLLVLDELLEKVAPGEIVAIVRDPAKLASYASRGVQVRQANYEDPADLKEALTGVDRLLLISGNEVGQRERQHGNVIQAAKESGVSYLAYTSILKGDQSRLPLAPEHVATERLLAASGLNYDVLRHGWYSDNYVGAIAGAVEAGFIESATGPGRLSTATRADFAAGAAAALVSSEGGKVYELAGDESWTFEHLAEELSRQAGKPIAFRNRSEDEYAGTLAAGGLPPEVAAKLAKTSALTASGELEDNSRSLSALSGRPTTPIAVTIAAALQG